MEEMGLTTTEIEKIEKGLLLDIILNVEDMDEKVTRSDIIKMLKNMARDRAQK